MLSSHLLSIHLAGLSLISHSTTCLSHCFPVSLLILMWRVRLPKFYGSQIWRKITPIYICVRSDDLISRKMRTFFTGIVIKVHIVSWISCLVEANIVINDRHILAKM